MESSLGKLAVLADAISDLGTFEAVLASFTPTIPLGPVTFAAGKAGAITVPDSGVLNVIEVPSVTLGSSSTLTLVGNNSGQSVVLKIDGDLKLGSNVAIRDKGVQIEYVVVYVGGRVASWGNNTTMDATVLAPNSPCPAGSGAKVDGAIICGSDVTFLQKTTLTFNPSGVDIPTIEGPIPFGLGDAAGFLVVSTGGNTKLGNGTVMKTAGGIGGSGLTPFGIAFVS